jgi:hypothetical protein
VVQVHAAVANGFMQLSADVTQLLFHPSGIAFPGFYQGVLVNGIDCEEIDEHDGSGIDAQLPFNGKLEVEGFETDHFVTP